MRPFNLDEALAGAPVCTRGNGSRVYDLHKFARARQSHKLVGVVYYGDILSWAEDGTFGLDRAIPDMDLMMWEEGDEIWGNDE